MLPLLTKAHDTVHDGVILLSGPHVAILHGGAVGEMGSGQSLGCDAAARCFLHQSKVSVAHRIVGTSRQRLSDGGPLLTCHLHMLQDLLTLTLQQEAEQMIILALTTLELTKLQLKSMV